MVTSATPTVRVTTTDPNDTEPSNTALVAGTITLHLTFVTAGFWSATATDASGSPTLAANTTGTIHAEAGTVTDLLVLLPGETYAPGTLTGKTGTPTFRARIPGTDSATRPLAHLRPWFAGNNLKKGVSPKR